MTVSEAIDQLQKLPPGAKLLRGDNSGGYEAVHEIALEQVEEIRWGLPAPLDAQYAKSDEQRIEAVVLK